MKTEIKNILKEQGLDSTPGKEETVQDVVEKVYPHIVTTLGPSEYLEETPSVEIWNDIYARYSGIPDMRGENSETTKAEWKAEDNTIYIYYPNMVNTEDIIRSLLHEYVHSLQDPNSTEKNREEGYDKDPGEIEAHQAEETWKDYLVYLENDLNEQKEQPGLSPELTYGDTILVVDVDRERESGDTSYTTPREQMRPETYTPYTVVDKESNGHKSQWRWRYTLVPEDKLEEYEESLDKGWGNYEGYEKLLYPWVYEWIFANTPKANKVDRLTLSENWRDTSWEDDDSKITIGDVTDYIGNDIRNISVSDLENKLGDNVFSVTQGEERIMKADLQYPIILVQKDGEFSYVLDGNHRLAKAIMTGEEYIKAKVLYLDDKNTPEEFKRLLGREEVINETINEQKKITSNGFSNQLVNYLKYVFTIAKGSNYPSFEKAVNSDYAMPYGSLSQLYLVLLANAEKFNVDIVTLLKTIPHSQYVIPSTFHYSVEYNGDYESWQELEDCVEEDGDNTAYGERSGEDCGCYSYEEISVIGPEEEDIEEFIDCNEATEEQLEKAGHDGECECTEWEDKEVELYAFPKVELKILSHNFRVYDIISDILGNGNTIDELNELLDEDSDYIILSKYDALDPDDEGEIWNYFIDSEEGVIDSIELDEEFEPREIIEDINRLSNYLKPPTLKEQNEQLKIFPYGDWEFPVGWEEVEDDTYGDVKNSVSENVFKKIFDMWDRDGIDFTILKLLGVVTNSVTNTYILKRYLQNTTKPTPVSYTYDCEDLSNLFDSHSFNDYDMGYIKKYLCGDETFWDPEEWYHHEWGDHMTDEIDENNWKTISDIFGGVSQSDAEDMLNRVSSSEEVDELTEKYYEQIDDIRHHILWANSDESEATTKNAMAEDIKEKIHGHFNGAGRLMNDNNGSFSYTIDGDLKDYVNDQWDNTDTFEYHPDHMNQPLEDVMLDYTMGNKLNYAMFAALIEEEYSFWNYCEGKKGDCLEVDTRFFDGYWYPTYDINEALSDRLGEVSADDYPRFSFSPKGETIPLQEKIDATTFDREGEVDGGYEDYTPFTSNQIGILNFIVKKFSMEELKTVAEEDDNQWPGGLYDKWSSTLKLVGERTGDQEEIGKSTRFARWILDNYQDARVEDFDDDSIDFKRMKGETAIKAWPSVFEVTGNEEGWQKEYRSGTIEIVGYDNDDATNKAESSFWDYEPDMETNDYGDYETDDFELSLPVHKKVMKENKGLMRIIESHTNHTCNLYELLVHQYKSINKINRKQLRETIENYLKDNSLDKNLLYLNEDEIINYLLNQGIIIEDKKRNSLIIEEPKTNNWWKNLPKKEKKNILENNLPTIDDETPKEIPEWSKKLLVVAKFTSSGTWGVAPSVFLLYMKPNGQIISIKKSSSLSSLPDEFKMGNTVTFGDLLSFENNSRYDLNMKGRLRETYLSTGRKLMETHTIQVTPQKQFYLKSLLKEMRTKDIDELLRISKNTKIGWQGGAGRLKVFDFLNKLRESGLVNMFQATDFLHSGSQWMRKYIDLHQPESLESVDEYEDSETTINHKETIQYLLDNADSVRDVIVSNVIAMAELKGDDTLEGASRLMRPASMDMVKLWAGHYVK